MTSPASRQAAVPAPGWTLKGWHVLAIVTGFFALIVGLDVWFATLAYRTFPGQVSDTPYEDGVAYNRRLAQEAAQASLGWQAAAAADPGRVRLELRDASGAPLSGLTVTGRLERPATEAGRITLAFREAGPGRYEAAVPGAAGAWDLSFRAAADEVRDLEGQRRLGWP